MDKKLLTVQELAHILGVPASWIYERTRLGQSAIPHVKMGKYVRFDLEAVVKFFKDKQSQDRSFSSFVLDLGILGVTPTNSIGGF